MRFEQTPQHSCGLIRLQALQQRARCALSCYLAFGFTVRLHRSRSRIGSTRAIEAEIRSNSLTQVHPRRAIERLLGRDFERTRGNHGKLVLHTAELREGILPSVAGSKIAEATTTSRAAAVSGRIEGWAIEIKNGSQARASGDERRTGIPVPNLADPSHPNLPI